MANKKNQVVKRGQGISTKKFRENRYQLNIFEIHFLINYKKSQNSRKTRNIFAKQIRLTPCLKNSNSRVLPVPFRLSVRWDLPGFKDKTMKLFFFVVVLFVRQQFFEKKKKQKMFFVSLFWTSIRYIHITYIYGMYIFFYNNCIYVVRYTIYLYRYL
jgi:hypothetical protein